MLDKLTLMVQPFSWMYEWVTIKNYMLDRGFI